MRKQLRLALLTVVCGSPAVVAQNGFAQDGFIVQPKLRQKAEAEESQRLRREADQQIERQPQNIRQRDTGQPPLTAPQTTAAGGPSPATRLASNSLAANSPASNSRGVRISNASQSSDNRQGLQWVTRGAAMDGSILNRGFIEVPRSAVTDLPTAGIQSLEFDNPEFYNAEQVPQPTVSETTAVPEPAPETVATYEEEERQRRAVVAELVSNKIIGNAAENDLGLTIPKADSSPGWQAVGERLTSHLRSCESSLRHKAYTSAREEAEQAAIYLVRVLDLANNSYDAEPTWYSALQALAEADDFTMFQRMSVDTDTLKRIIDSHETTVLKGAATSDVSPLVAAQHYRQFAEQQLVRASQGHPWASDIFYSMGRAFQAQAEEADSDSDLLRLKAVTFYRAAATISPRNSIASNQLGYILLQMDRPQDAREALVASLGASASKPALENLVEASRRLGDQSTMHWAVQQLAANQRMMPQAADTPVVMELEPREFIAISPRSSGPQSQGSPAPQIASGYNGSPYPGSIQR